jgi:hypothetical protein
MNGITNLCVFFSFVTRYSYSCYLSDITSWLCVYDGIGLNEEKTFLLYPSFLWIDEETVLFWRFWGISFFLFIHLTYLLHFF